MFFPQLTSASSSKWYKIDLCYIENGSVDPPVITFVNQSRDIIQDPVDIGISGSEMVKIAFTNLRKVDLDLIVEDYGLGKLLTLVDVELASEKILDQTFLKSAGDRLQTDFIKVAIPVRNSILICDGTNGESVKCLNVRHRQLYNDFSKTHLSNLVFDVVDGVIQEAHPVTYSNRGLPFDDQISRSYKEQILFSKLFENLFNIRLIVEAESMSDMQNGLFKSILHLIKSNYSNRDFNKSIEIHLNSDVVKGNDQNRKSVGYLLDRIQDEVKTWGGSIAVAIKISFLFSEDFRAGNSHKKIIKTIKLD